MSKYRKKLPQLSDRLFVTDAGLETELVFHDGIDLPCFASFTLLSGASGIERLRRYYAHYAEMAQRFGLGLVLEAPTWRANRDWGEKLGYDAARLADANRTAIGLMLEIRAAYETPQTRIVISGNLGPRGDGYRADRCMSADEAQDYHAAQLETFAQTDADMAAAFTMNYVEEAIGIVHGARAVGLPVAISFTLETDGRLPAGDTLQQAIERTDAETDGYAAYFMINCAHPTHFASVLEGAGRWRERIRGLRANASRRSHAELDESTDLDAGDPLELGGQYRALRPWLPKLAVVGGCCGTDHRHVESICAALAGVHPTADAARSPAAHSPKVQRAA
jgi:S-methylmethionine-dependent homocysteine/selenocysteine methylase